VVNLQSLPLRDVETYVSAVATHRDLRSHLRRTQRSIARLVRATSVTA
jgi:cytidylate kinase